MDQLRTTPASRLASRATFIHKDLRDSNHVFVRKDTTRRALESPYSDPHKVIAALTKRLQMSCAFCRSLCRRTELSQLTY